MKKAGISAENSADNGELNFLQTLKPNLTSAGSGWTDIFANVSSVAASLAARCSDNTYKTPDSCPHIGR